MKILAFDNVWEKYRIKFVQEGNVYWKEIWALENVSFSVEKGEVVGIIGRNGAGKTTLLKLIAGMLIPDKGNVSVEGRVSALMELGAGFNPEFTGIENIKLNATLYGLSEESLREKMRSIIDFANLGDFINAPVKYYSQGMYMRLAFSLAIFVEPDILLIDDILAVGDENTQRKCIKKIFELKESGKTIILVSHDMNMVSKLCNRVILLEEGKIVMKGLPEKVIARYLETAGDRKDIAVLEEKFLRKQQQDLARLRRLCTISSGNLSLYADVEKKAIRLYYKGKEITKARGLYIAMEIEEEEFWIHSSDAQWQINKISDKELVISLEYEKLSLQKFLKLFCKDKDTLEINIEAQINKPISFMHYDVRLELKDLYRSWQTPYEKGDFAVRQFLNNIAPIRLKDNKISYVMLEPRNGDNFPTILFSSSSHLDRRIMAIYKYKGSNGEYLCINSSLTIPRKDRLLGVGKYTFLKGKILLNNDVKPIAKERREGAIEVSGEGKLKVIFYQGKGRIFWENKELTTGLSVYTSLRSSGIWYDSYQAVWEVAKKETNKILVSGDWSNLPISQIWEIELINSNLIYWEVHTNIYEEVIIEIEQANIMLSSGYRNWEAVGFTKGEFIDEYTNYYDILPFRFWYGKSDEISASDKDLPRVIFKSNAEKLNLRALIENTDSLYQARLLQYQKENIHKLVRGKHLFFKGVIKIGSD